MNINHSDPVTWLNALWEVIGEWEDKYDVYPEDLDDVKTVMAWIAGALGYDINPETGEYVLEEEMIND
jgi:hypothetical protein